MTINELIEKHRVRVDEEIMIELPGAHWSDQPVKIAGVHLRHGEGGSMVVVLELAPGLGPVPVKVDEEGDANV